MSREDDVELAEQRRRASENNAQRTGYRRLGDDDGPSRPVPCRGCGVEVPISGFAWELAKTLTLYAMTRGEPPLEAGELTFCAPCGAEHQRAQLARAHERGERVSQLVRHTKATGERAPEHVESWLRRNGYPDMPDALRGICDRVEAARAKNGGRGKRER